MALVGYARTSTADQKAGMESQIRDLKQAQCERIFSEELSSVATKRPVLDECLSYLRDGDTLVATKIDRLARSTADLLNMVQKLQDRNIALRFLSNPELNTDSPNGKLMITVLGAIAQFERELMLERQREGIAKAKAEGKYKGRAPTARRQQQQIIDLRAKGMTGEQVAKELGISRRSVYRLQSNDRLSLGSLA
jgi:DNA invertase Pin-like site-specific DNA recombinase